MSKAVIIAGTDTDVGKTIVSAGSDGHGCTCSGEDERNASAETRGCSGYECNATSEIEELCRGGDGVVHKIVLGPGFGWREEFSLDCPTVPSLGGFGATRGKP